MVFSSIYPVASDEYEDLARAIEKLKLNDAALTFQKDSSSALGFGFRCGFLGLLHLDIVQERLEREYDLSLVLSAPSVQYEVRLNDGREILLDNPSYYPDPSSIALVREPFIKAKIMMPERYLGGVMELCRERRGDKLDYTYLAVGRLELSTELPLAEVLFDFYDRLKTLTQGYGSFDYELLDYRADRPGQGRHPGQRREGGRAVAAHPPRRGAGAGAALLRAAQGHHPAPAVQDRDPGRDRRADHRPLDHQRLPQGRDREVLRRRHQPQAQAAREAEGRQEADEDGRARSRSRRRRSSPCCARTRGAE